MLVRLEQERLRVMASAGDAVAASDSGIFIIAAPLTEGGMVLPWERGSAPVGDAPVGDADEAAARIREGEALEFGVLRHLAAHEGGAVTRVKLLHAVWGYKRFPTTRTVDNHIASLRSKLEDDLGQPKRILTVHGVGYRLGMSPQ